jgi:hypothetical protein
MIRYTIRYDRMWYVTIRYDMIWYMIWYDMIWYDMIYDMIWWCDMIWYDMIRYDTMRYDAIRYDTIRYGMIYLLTAIGLPTRGSTTAFHSLPTLLLPLYLPCSSFFLPFILSSRSFLTFILCVCLPTPYSFIYALLPARLFPYPPLPVLVTHTDRYMLTTYTGKRFSNFISQCPAGNFDKNIQCSSRHSDNRDNVTCSVTKRSILVTIVAVEIQYVLHILGVCLCSSVLIITFHRHCNHELTTVELNQSERCPTPNDAKGHSLHKKAFLLPTSK